MLRPLRTAASNMLKDLSRIPTLLEKANSMPLEQAIKEAEKLAASAQLIFKIANSLTLTAARQSANLPYDTLLQPSGFVRSSKAIPAPFPMSSPSRLATLQATPAIFPTTYPTPVSPISPTAAFGRSSKAVPAPFPMSPPSHLATIQAAPAILPTTAVLPVITPGQVMLHCAAITQETEYRLERAYSSQEAAKKIVCR